MKLKDELRLRIQTKIRERFTLEEQKKLAKNYYALFRDELVNLTIDAFVEYLNGDEIPVPKGKNSRGPKPIYKDNEFLQELVKMIDQGQDYSAIREALGVSDPTISRAKNYLKEKGLIPS